MHAVINSLLIKPVSRIPVWLMRQAGRYLPEYRKLREQVPDFMTFCKTPALAAQATLQPITRFPLLDAAIIFSDILTIPDALGLNVNILPSEGPIIRDVIQNEKDIQRIAQYRVDDVLANLQYVPEAIRLVMPELGQRIPLIGFAGSPWTVACYMIEGRSSNSFEKAKVMLYQRPDLLHTLLQALTEITAAYLKTQIEAGAAVIMLFDTWGGLLTQSAYQQFSLHYLSFIAKTLKTAYPAVPIIFFTKNAGLRLESLAVSGCHAIGLDWTISLGEAHKRIGGRVALQGNLDPVLLLTDPKTIQHAIREILSEFGAQSGLVFNLGHGILPQTPVENVQVLLETVRAFGLG